LNLHAGRFPRPDVQDLTWFDTDAFRGRDNEGEKKRSWVFHDNAMASGSVLSTRGQSRAKIERSPKM
ncbi:MAG: hypothetical protein ACI9OD_005150, partial [Limisphaerales bacterium]